jgi:hypothetical protein
LPFIFNVYGPYTNAYRSLVRKTEKKSSLEKAWLIWEYHVKAEGYEGEQDLSGTGLGLVRGCCKQHK